MEIIAAMLATSITTSAVMVLAWTFLRKPPEKETKKLEKCPTCKRWQEVK